MSRRNQNKTFAHAIAYENGKEFGLPPTERIRVRYQSDYYGASSEFVSYAGRSPNKWKLDWLWQHGWIPNFSLVDPLVITATVKGLERDESWFVSVAEEKRFFNQNGFKSVEAVGLPIIYTNTGSVDRIADSLLVMPIHSSPWAALPQKFREFVAMVHDLKPFFSKIVFCLHESCLDNGLWVNELREFDIPYVLGASISDRNSLTRSSLLFQQFETVLTNGFGSHLSYAAAFGAKLSIFGEYPKIDPSGLKNEPFYRKFPHLLKTYIPLCSEENIRDKLEFLFCDPLKAKAHVDWGRRQIGWSHKVTPKAARGFLARREESILSASKIKQKGKNCIWKGLHILPDRLETRVSCLVSKSYRDQLENRERFEGLRNLPRFVPGKIDLYGRSWVYADSVAFFHAYNAIYQQRCFAVRLDSVVPRMIDAGSHVGMVSRFWKEQFPRAEVLAIEADENLIPLIQRNLQELEGPEVQILHSALWKNSSGVEFEAQGADAGHVLDDDSAKGFRVRIPSVSLEEIVSEKRVDILKMDIEGAEGEVIMAGREALRWVDRIFVEYHSRVGQPQELADILLTLRSAGFRVWLNSEYTPERPFVSQPAPDGMDLQLNIFAIKEDLLCG